MCTKHTTDMYQTERDQHYMNGRNHGLADKMRISPPAELLKFNDDYRQGYYAGYYSH